MRKTRAYLLARIVHIIGIYDEANNIVEIKRFEFYASAIINYSADKKQNVIGLLNYRSD